MLKIRLLLILLVIILLGALGIATTSAQAPAGCVNVVTVWDGDTLYSIARARNFVVAELAAVNNIPVTYRVRIGDRLCIDGLAVAQEPPPIGGGDPDPGTGTPPPVNTTYNFRRGQGPLPAGWRTVNVAFGNTLYSISRAVNASVQQLVTANNIVNVHQIFAGETLMFPPANTNPPGNDGTGGNTNTPVHRPAPGTIPRIGLPAQARAGDSISVTGANYPGNVPIDIYFEHVVLGLKTGVITTVTTNPNGTFSQMVTVPNAFSNGAAISQLPSVSVSGYTRTGGYWAMNYFAVAR